MDKINLFNVMVFCLTLAVERTLVVSCPSGCSCRGVAVRCSPGLTAIPSLDAGVKMVSISGNVTTPNIIPNIKQADFASADLFVLIITYSGVQTVESGAFSNLVTLRDLSLSNNNLQELDGESFKGLSSLRTLDVSGNKGCPFDASMFKYLTDLEELNLGAMEIETLDKNVFSPLKSLKRLKLYSNNLVKIHFEVLQTLTSLETLDLTGNKLLGLPAELKPKFQAMKSVHLSKNPWQCNCQLLWLREIPTSYVTSLVDNTEIVCNGPSRLKYQSFMNVPEKEFICIPPKVVQCDATSYNLDVNSRLIISCTFDGDPIPDVKWTRPAGSVIDGYDTVEGHYHIIHNGTLVVDGVTPVDDGDWTVSAYNKTAIDSMKINVHVIVTTTTSSTTSSLTAKTSRSSAASSALSHSTPAASDPTKAEVGDREDNVRTIIKDNGINYGLLAAAAAGGGTLVGIMCICIMCCKKKHKDENNRVSPFESDV